MYPYLIQSNTITIGSYGLMLAIAYLTGRWYFLGVLNKKITRPINSEMLIIALLVLGVVGAKLMFLLKNPEQSHLIYSGIGFSSQGALLGAFLAVYLFCYFNKVKLSTILDSAAPAAILAYAIARVGCFLSGDDCYGIVTDLPWAMSFPNGIKPTVEHVHPVPIYEIIYSIFIFYILAKRQNDSYKPYTQIFTLLGLWGFFRFFVEFVSTNEKLVFSMSGSQIGALFMFFVSMIFFTLFIAKQKALSNNKKPR